jgi:hypothetical protein
MTTPTYAEGRFDAETEAAKSHFDLAELCKCIGDFGDSPPANLYQRGYLKRLLQLANDALKVHPQ